MYPTVSRGLLVSNGADGVEKKAELRLIIPSNWLLHYQRFKSKVTEMTVLNSNRSSLEGYIETNWTTTPISYEEVPYIPTAGTAFIEVWVNDGGSTHAAMPNTQRFAGVLQIDINVPKGSGTATARTYADTIIGLFNGKQVDSITFRDLRVHKDPSGEWYTLSLAWEWYVDSHG